MIIRILLLCVGIFLLVKMLPLLFTAAMYWVVGSVLLSLLGFVLVALWAIGDSLWRRSHSKPGDGLVIRKAIAQTLSVVGTMLAVAIAVAIVGHASKEYWAHRAEARELVASAQRRADALAYYRGLESLHQAVPVEVTVLSPEVEVGDMTCVHTNPDDVVLPSEMVCLGTQGVVTDILGHGRVRVLVPVRAGVAHD